MAERPAPPAHAATSPSGTSAAWADASSAPDEGAQLALRAAAGDRVALSTLLRTHAQPIASLCHHVAGPAEARDAAQEAFERIVRELSRFDPTRGTFRAWSLTIARNVCRDRLRRRTLERGAFAADGDAQTAIAVGGQPDPERLVIAREGASTLARTLEGLPPPMREALVMFHVGEASYEDIAAALDVPMGTVMTWLHRGRQRLRAAIEEP